MITRIVKVKVKPEKVDKFRASIRNFICEAIAFKNNHHADCFADLDDPNHFHIYTIWDSEGALNKFRKSEFNLGFRTILKECAEQPYSAWTVENIAK